MTSVLPKWLKRVVTDLGGRDPLGLSRTALLLTDQLLPGVVVNTDRARYYSLYSWILWHIEQTAPTAARPDFVAEFQRREAVVAATTILGSDEATAIGFNAVSSRLEDAKKSGEFTTQFQVLPSNALGGYGQYYTGCLHDLGLTHRPREDGIDRVTDGMATAIAKATHQVVADTPYIKQQEFNRTSVDLSAIKKSGRLSLDFIRDPACAKERELLVTLFFGLHSDGRDTTAARRNTLSRLLATIDAYEGAGIAIGEKTFTEQVVYAPAYFGTLISPDLATAQSWQPDKKLLPTGAGWAQFCLHQFLTLALEGLLDAILQVLQHAPAGVAVDALAAELVDKRFHDHVRGLVGVDCATPGELLHALGVASVPSSKACELAQASGSYTSNIGEWHCEAKVTTPSEICARSCIVLAVLYSKWRGSDHVTYRDLLRRAGHDLVAPSVLPWLDAWLQPATTWAEALRMLFVHIVQHHDRVMYDKGRLESCWIDRRDDRLVYAQEYEPFRRSTRHNQARRILDDLGLVEWRDAKGERSLFLTPLGRTVLGQALAVTP
jgi:hypothetical protein